LINGGATIDFDAVQKAKEYGLARLDYFYRELGSERRLFTRRSNERKTIVQRAIERGMCRIEDAQKFGLDPFMTRAEWDQLEQVIKEAQEMRDKRYSAVAEFLPNPLAEMVCVYERGPLRDEEIQEVRSCVVEEFLPKVLAQVVVQYEFGDEYDDMPALEDASDGEPEDEILEN
jgi:hypothetical protein